MYSSIVHSCTNNTVVAGYHDSRRNTDTPYRSLWRYICSSCARAGVFPGIPACTGNMFAGTYRYTGLPVCLVYRFFWSCHYRPVNRDIDCTKTGEYCAQHALEGMVNVKSKKCRTEGCGKLPSFGVTGTKNV